MRKLRPTVALGYLCEGDVYCRQGRYAFARTIYDMGLEAVLPSDPDYRLLGQQHTATVKFIYKRIDFISQLPMDIVSTNIMPRFMPTLLSTGCSPYLYVSRTWQQRILQHGLSVEVDYEHEFFPSDHEQLIRYAPYVKCLHLTVNMKKHLARILSLAKFSSLKKVKLAYTLTHLDLFEKSLLQIPDIMKTCPNLVSLKIRKLNADIPSSIGSSLQYSQLTHLAIQYFSLEIKENDSLIRVLNVFPQLVYLELGAMPESSILPLLQKHGQHLRMINFGRWMETRNPIIDYKDKGITVARLGQVDHFNQDDMIKFLLQHSQTLMDLDLDMLVTTRWEHSFEFSEGALINREQEDGAARSSRVSFPNLHTLHLVEGYHSQGHFFQWVIDHALQLKSISIPELLFVKAMVRGLKRLQHLTRLHIYEVAEEYEENGAAIEDFVQYHADLGSQSTLEHVTITFDTVQVPMVSWIVSMCWLQRLTKLELLAETMMCDWTLFFVYMSRGCPALQELTIGNGRAFIDGSFIKVFRTYPNLRSLYIGANHLLEIDLRHLARIPSLECVYLCFPPRYSIANYLNERGIAIKPFVVPRPHDVDNKW